MAKNRYCFIQLAVADGTDRALPAPDVLPRNPARALGIGETAPDPDTIRSDGEEPVLLYSTGGGGWHGSGAAGAGCSAAEPGAGVGDRRDGAGSGYDQIGWRRTGTALFNWRWRMARIGRCRRRMFCRGTRRGRWG